jgi:hypothetical protein
MFVKSSTKFVLAAAALVIAFASVEASAKPIVIPKGPVKIAPKGPIIVKPVLPKGPIIVKPLLPKKPPIIVTPKFPKKPPIIIVTPKFPKPVIVSPIVVERPILRPVALAPRPVVSTCNCLTKEYTQEGQVVFKDLCTQEMAMAPVAGAEPQKSSDAQSPANFAGKTYQDYLAANGTQQN